MASGGRPFIGRSSEVKNCSPSTRYSISKQMTTAKTIPEAMLMETDLAVYVGQHKSVVQFEEFPPFPLLRR